MARKKKVSKEASAVSTPAYSYPQPYGAQYPMMDQFGGQPSAYSGAFTYEPVRIRKHARSAILFVLLNIITLGIYGLVVMSHISQEINLIASDYDRKTTPFYCLACFLSCVTFGIYGVVYMNNLCARIGIELKRRNIKYKFDEGTYWGWDVFGVLLLFIGPFIFYHKLFKAMRKLIEDHNIYG